MDGDHERAAAAYAAILTKDHNEPTALNNLVSSMTRWAAAARHWSHSSEPLRLVRHRH